MTTRICFNCHHVTDIEKINCYYCGVTFEDEI